MKRWWGLGLLLLWATSVLADTPFYTASTKTRSASGAGDAAATALWTPTTGSFIVLQGCVFSAQTASSIRLQVSGTDIVPPIYVPSQGLAQVGGTTYPIYVSATNAVITYTVSTTGMALTSGSWSVMCWGSEQNL